MQNLGRAINDWMVRGLRWSMAESTTAVANVAAGVSTLPATRPDDDPVRLVESTVDYVSMLACKTLGAHARMRSIEPGLIATDPTPPARVDLEGAGIDSITPRRPLNADDTTVTDLMTDLPYDLASLWSSIGTWMDENQPEQWDLVIFLIAQRYWIDLQHTIGSWSASHRRHGLQHLREFLHDVINESLDSIAAHEPYGACGTPVVESYADRPDFWTAIRWEIEDSRDLSGPVPPLPSREYVGCTCSHCPNQSNALTSFDPARLDYSGDPLPPDLDDIIDPAGRNRRGADVR